MRPIPRRLLPDSMTARPALAGPGHAGGEVGEPVEVGHVRFARASALRLNAYQLADESKGVVFVDAASSEGAVELPVGSMLTVRQASGGTFEVCVTACRAYEGAGGRVHHWELEVS